MTDVRSAIRRRDLLRATGGVSAVALATMAMPKPVRAMMSGALDTSLYEPMVPSTSRSEYPIDHPDVKALALRAIDAAKSAGATYADVRLTRTEYQSLWRYQYSRVWTDRESLGFGVRALVNGYWGFAASPIWTNDEAVQLAQDAVAQAKTNALGTARTVEFEKISIASGSWTMPVKYDPFTIPLEEKVDFLQSWYDAAASYSPRVLLVMANANLTRQARAVATSEGAYFTQTVYDTDGTLSFKVSTDDWRKKLSASATVHGVTGSGKGWELFLDAAPHTQIPRMFEEADEVLRAPRKPVELGRYDIVFAAPVVAALLDRTIGVATELDRALGYEANASGTSYLSNPLAMLGTYKAGSPLVTVTGSRSDAGALATVKWDDEGVTPNEMTLVRDGIVTDFQTTREQAAWLAPWYQRQQMPVRSHGCAAAASALNITMQRSPNLVLRPGTTAATFEDLVANTKKGIAVCETEIFTDHQARNGSSGGESLFREIVNGKLGAVIDGGSILFNTTELWSNVTAVGGAESAEWRGLRRRKGQPEQETSHSVSAVPIAAKNLSIIDATRKA